MLKIFISEGVELKKTAKNSLKVIGHGRLALPLFHNLLLVSWLALINKFGLKVFNFLNLIPDKKIGFVLCSTLIGIFISAIILWGVTYSVLAFRDDQKKKPNIFKATFAAFGNGNYAKTLKTSFLTNLFMTLWGILFIIPGIIKAY